MSADTESIENLFKDPAPWIKVRDFVQVKVDRIVDDEGTEIASKGDVGRVVRKAPSSSLLLGHSLPTVQFERTGAIYDVEPEEIDVLAPDDFATREETTPKKPLREPIRRGVM